MCVCILELNCRLKLCRTFNGDYIDVNIFGAYSNTDWVHYPSSNTVIDQLKWYQDDEIHIACAFKQNSANAGATTPDTRAVHFVWRCVPPLN